MHKSDKIKMESLSKRRNGEFDKDCSVVFTFRFFKTSGSLILDVPLCYLLLIDAFTLLLHDFVLLHELLFGSLESK